MTILGLDIYPLVRRIYRNFKRSNLYEQEIVVCVLDFFEGVPIWE